MSSFFIAVQHICCKRQIKSTYKSMMIINSKMPSNKKFGGKIKKADPIYQAIWQKQVKQYKTSNQNMKQFSYENNVKVYQLQYWLKKY